MTQTNNEREAFEKWYQSQFTGKVDFKRYSANPIYYDNDDIDTSWEAWEARAQSPISQNEQQEAVACAWEYESPDKTWKSITTNKTELQDHLEIGCTLVRELFTSPPKQAIPEGWKLVPIVPNERMLDVGESNYQYGEPSSYKAGLVYKAMLNAAPTNTEVGK